MSAIRKKFFPLVSLFIVSAVVAGLFGGLGKAAAKNPEAGISGTDSAMAAKAEEAPDVQWFKDQMKISDKYVEQQEGVLGVSWAHFLTMVFLVLFALGALVAFFQRQRRTREILEMIRKEMSHGDNS
jgi:disulfide bond formation protein DsbB